MTTPPVLMYHSISTSRAADPHRLRVHPDRLDRHLRLLRRLGLRGVPLAEPWARRRLWLVARPAEALPAPARLLLDHLLQPVPTAHAG
jgi:hypothetical protein